MQMSLQNLLVKYGLTEYMSALETQGYDVLKFFPPEKDRLMGIGTLAGMPPGHQERFCNAVQKYLRTVRRLDRDRRKNATIFKNCNYRGARQSLPARIYIKRKGGVLFSAPQETPPPAKTHLYA